MKILQILQNVRQQRKRKIYQNHHKKGGKRLRIVAVEKADKLQNLVARPEIIQGDPDDLVNISWKH